MLGVDGRHEASKTHPQAALLGAVLFVYLNRPGIAGGSGVP
jgi:hypothetical protein